jgi:hypothetical protein
MTATCPFFTVREKEDEKRKKKKLTNVRGQCGRNSLSYSMTR